jgi:hypothetical protein
MCCLMRETSWCRSSEGPILNVEYSYLLYRELPNAEMTNDVW